MLMAKATYIWCKGTYTPYRINIWGLRKTDTNREEGRQMVQQQVQNILRHLKEAHDIEKHLVTGVGSVSSHCFHGSYCCHSSQGFPVCGRLEFMNSSMACRRVHPHRSCRQQPRPRQERPSWAENKDAHTNHTNKKGAQGHTVPTA